MKQEANLVKKIIKQRRLLSAQECADELGISKNTFYQTIGRHIEHDAKFSKTKYYTKGTLLKFLQSKSVGKKDKQGALQSSSK